MSATPATAHRGLPPRVALVRLRYDPFGGAERFVQGAIEALKARGATLSVVTRHWPDHDGSAIVLDPFYLGGLWRDWGFARAVCRELGRHHFDLVQSHERIACCDLYRAGDGVHREWLRQRARVQSPLGRIASTLSPRHRYVLAAERALFTSPRLKAVICNSDMVRREIEAHFGTPAGKLVLIRNAVDSTRFHPRLRAEHREGMRQQLKIPADAQVALLVGSGFERKGVATLLAATALAGPQAWALVVGKDKRSGHYQALARKLGIAGRVRFAGAVSDVGPYYGAADCFVLPALYDPFPNAALEAMACGLPILTSTKCGVAELVRDDRNGFVRDALDVPALAEILAGLDPSTCARLGAHARATVVALSAGAMADQYLALYERLLRK